jgi:polyphosphate kinase 2 (PPK2 family)
MITEQQVIEYLENKQKEKHEREKKLLEDLQNWLKNNKCEIVCIIQTMDNGSYAIPNYGIREIEE